MPVTSTHKYRKHSQRNLAFVVIDGRRVYLGKFGSPESQAGYHRESARLLPVFRRRRQPDERRKKE